MAALVAGLGGVVALQCLWPLAVLVALAPAASHIRWVGWKRAITEPSPAAVVILFYLAIVPQRMLGIAYDDYHGILFAPETVSQGDLLRIMLLFALGTTVFVEAFHATARRARKTKETKPHSEDPATPDRIVMFAFVLSGVALGSLMMIILQFGGFAGTVNTFAGHDKSDFDAARSIWLSLWATFAVPSLWSSALLFTKDGVAPSLRWSSIGLSAIVALSQLVLFGSRLSVILGLVGAWTVWYFAGRRISTVVVLASIVALIGVSIPLLNARSGVNTQIPQHTRLSTTIGYGILDVSLAVQQRPDDMRASVLNAHRWIVLPEFLVPFWPGRESATDLRIDKASVRNFGTPNQQESGFPISFVSETWLIGGWLAVAIALALFGVITGSLHRLLANSGAPSAASLIWYALVVTASFSYFKDGDTWGSLIAIWRTIMYVGAAMWACGIWDPLTVVSSRRRRHRPAKPTNPAVHRPVRPARR